MTSSLLEALGQILQILGASFIAPLMAVVYGLLSEPLQRRSRKGTLEYLEKKISVGKQLLEVGEVYDLNLSERIRVKRELVASARLYQTLLMERSLAKRQDRTILYLRPGCIWFFPRPRTKAGWVYNMFLVYIFSGFFLVGLALFREFLAPEPNPSVLWFKFWVGLILFAITYEACLFVAVVIAQSSVIGRRRRIVPSFKRKPITASEWTRGRYLLSPWARNPAYGSGVKKS